MSDAEEEVEKELIKLDYDEVDPETGFKKVELTVWRGLEEWKAKPEDDREPAGDPAELDSRLEWAKWYATEGPVKPDTEDPKALATFENRCLAVVRLGIYAGARDEYNQKTGKGKAVYSNGDSFEGRFYEGKRNGQGRYTSVSLGKSEIDELVEKMVMALPEDTHRVYMPLNGSWSVASSAYDEFVDAVTTTLACSKDVVKTALEFGYHSFYFGDYENGVRNGTGIMKMRDGSVYKGEWKEGKRNGQGILYYMNGDTYSGHWKDGSKCGYGTYSFAHWEKGTDGKTGKPVYTYSPGGDYRGEWGDEEYTVVEEDGEKITKTKRGLIKEGEWRMPDGLYYEGTFNKEYLPHSVNQPPAVYAPDGVPPPLDTHMRFPKHGLVQAGVMKKGHWAPQLKLIAVEAPEETGY